MADAEYATVATGGTAWVDPATKENKSQDVILLSIWLALY
jgi:hypothetical protein